MQTERAQYLPPAKSPTENEDAILAMARRDLTVRAPGGDDLRIWDRAVRIERAVLQVADLVDRQGEANRIVLRLAALYLLAGWVEDVRRGNLTVDDFMRRPTSMAQYALAVQMLDPESGPIGDASQSERIHAIRAAAVIRLGDDAKRAAMVLATHAGLSVPAGQNGNNGAPSPASVAMRESMPVRGSMPVRESSLVRESLLALAPEHAGAQHHTDPDSPVVAINPIDPIDSRDAGADLDTPPDISKACIEVRILADAERLDWPTQICEQALARTARTRGTISQWTEFLTTRKNYGYWDEYLRGDFQFEPVRQAARWRITRITACIDLLEEIFHSEDLSAQQ